MTSIESVILEVPDPTTAGAFYDAAFGLRTQVIARASEAPTTGFRGFTLSLVVSRPATVAALFGAALEAGATTHRIVVGADAGPFTDPDGFVWEATPSATAKMSMIRAASHRAGDPDGR